MQAYFDQPEETARVLSADGWLDTGDLGYTLDGEIVITGRAKDLIIVNGRNVWPQDLEWTPRPRRRSLRSGDVAVFSVGRRRRASVVAVLAPSSAGPATPRPGDALCDEVAGAARRSPWTGRRGGAGAAARPAADLVGQAQSRRAPRPCTWPALFAPDRSGLRLST